MDNDTLAITLLSHITKLSAGCSAAKQTVAMANMANAAVKSLRAALSILFGIIAYSLTLCLRFGRGGLCA